MVAQGTEHRVEYLRAADGAEIPVRVFGPEVRDHILHVVGHAHAAILTARVLRNKGAFQGVRMGHGNTVLDP